MIVVLRRDVTEDHVEQVRDLLVQEGYEDAICPDARHAVVCAVGTIGAAAQQTLAERLQALDMVEQVVATSRPYRIAGREWKEENTVVPIRDGPAFGGEEVILIAGPCAVESREQMLQSAREVQRRGADLLRGGAFKPRTSPHAFQGLGREGLCYLLEASQQTGLPIVTEIMDTRDLDAVMEIADVLQIGSRNMQNYSLLKVVGKCRKPVLLKRGMSSTMEEWLQAAEYILSGGNPNVILCERGIRTFETWTRNTLDLNAVPVMKRLTHLPVIVDPSHGTGAWGLVIPMSLAAIAAGADGLIVEVHPDPARALSDGPQSLTPEHFSELVARAGVIAQGVGRRLRSKEEG
jgi:3-deoxy-7-phosphoheptulonate synthase